MKKQASRRSRGVILTLKGWDKLQAAKSEAEFEDNTRERFCLEELSDRMRLSLHTVSRILGRSEPVDKSSLQKAFAAFGLKLSKSDYTRLIAPFDDLEARQASPMYDWGEAPDTSVFYGRSVELLQLRHWVFYHLNKQGIDFADAVSVFSDKLAITIFDDRFEEERFITIGMDILSRILVVVYTLRDDEIRLISARKATRNERRQYEEKYMIDSEYDFSQGKRGAVESVPPGKTRITIRLDDDILAWFRTKVHEQGGGNYQTLIKDALRQHIQQKREPLEETLRRVLREELKQIEK